MSAELASGEGAASSVSPFPRRRVGGLEFAVTDREGAAAKIVELATLNSQIAIDVHLSGAHGISEADKHPTYRVLLNSAAINFPDGRPLTWVTRFSKQRLRQVYGPHLLQDVLALGIGANVKHFLLGGTPETIALLAARLHADHPGVEIVGKQSPPFRDLTADEVIAQDRAIRESNADIVWIGLGAPKQDWEAARLAHSIPVIAVAVGAAFDFAAGTKRQAPEWMRQIGLEWAFRFATEPRRLWRRYIFGNARFIWAVLKHLPTDSLGQRD